MKWVKRILIIMICIVSLVCGVLGITGFLEYKNVTNKISIEEYINKIEERDDYISYEDINENLLNATIAIEDHRFYEHNGVDIIGIGRAVYQNIMAKGITGGGSTITQQLAKNLYYTQNYSLTRKVAEIFTAWEIEQRYTKDKILELYVNIINYGDNYIGIYKASKGYFNVQPKDLNLSQSSILAGLPQSPSNFQLSNHYESAKIRQQQVLSAMQREGMISDEQSAAAYNED